ncbi:hypothetical protein WJX73_010320 [Symbiochloris irregularis]|uniref:DUF1223 domain-containing protein n=1 Tax=Symbiochloris irregularis TaxID=706552 RepID=A0AAW1NZI5_9CHLO
MFGNRQSARPVDVSERRGTVDRDHWQSSEAQAHVVELFTSEGCSSCPPADQLLVLADHDALFRTVIPVAWHVDYWDYLGWVDPFASAAHTARQRQYAREWNSKSVYTPCFCVDGQPTRHFSKALKSLGPGSSVGVLEARDSGDGSFRVTFHAQGKLPPALCSYAQRLLPVGLFYLASK